MVHEFTFFLGGILLIIVLILIANKIKVAYPILLVVGGLIACFVPGVPSIRINPEMIFVLFLPPLLYEAAWAISWKELWKWRRIISSFAFIVVFITAIVVAFVANAYIPGFSLALGFLLGGIVSPPDAVSAGAIMKFVKVPPRLKAIIEGESLFNDASSLIILRFAILAVTTGQFIWQEAALSFGWMVVGGVGIGLLVALVFYKTHKLLPTNAEMDIVLTLVAPYVMYIVAEELHSSGVLSVVSGGLLLANRKHHFLSSESRVKAGSVWESFSFVLNGLVFILIGLDLPEIVNGLEAEGADMKTAMGYGILITGVLVVVRILSAYGAVFVTFILKNFITVADSRSPGYKAPFLLGWAGMRGVVSLAAALSIPVTLADGTPFPQRNLILFITFVVIVLTLVLQGLTLPYFIKKIQLVFEEDFDEDDYASIYHKLNRKTNQYAKENLNAELAENPILQNVLNRLSSISSSDAKIILDEETKEVILKVMDKQREWLTEWNKNEKVDENHIRRHFYRLDLEEIGLELK
jgi:Na+/H+ antiporter